MGFVTFGAFCASKYTSPVQACLREVLLPLLSFCWRRHDGITKFAVSHELSSHTPVAIMYDRPRDLSASTEPKQIELKYINTPNAGSPTNTAFVELSDKKLAGGQWFDGWEERRQEGVWESRQKRTEETGG